MVKTRMMKTWWSRRSRGYSYINASFTEIGPDPFICQSTVYMALVIDNRRVTEDVDIILLDYPETHNKTPETKAFKAAVRAVASKYKLKREWMNDVAAYFIRDIAPEIPPLNFWKEYEQLSVYVPPQEYILALKLIVYREKDKDDVEALLKTLQITTREQTQTIVNRYVPSREQQDYYMLDSALDDLF